VNEPFFILELAHSTPGRAPRINITPKRLLYVAVLFGFMALIAGGLFSRYVQMSWKAQRYNELHANFDRLRTRYLELQRISLQHNEQMASLESLATEVSVEYGIRRPASTAGTVDLGPVGSAPQTKESIEQYNFLKAASFSGIYHRYAHQWQSHVVPSAWPLEGVVRSPFGARSDPFSGEGAFHTGIDLAAASGTPVRVTADGVVVSAGWSSGYGKLITIDHGNGVETYYAHLSQSLVVPGQEVRIGQVIALSGGTGRSTSPHLHYEIRVGGTPVNPYRYLARPDVVRVAVAAAKPLRSDLGL